MVTCEMVRDWLLAYLNGEVTLETLVDWARRVKLDGQVSERDAAVVGPVLARIGVTGKGGYDLTWEDGFDLLEDLGFAARVVTEPIQDGDDEEGGEDGEEGEGNVADW